MNLLMLILSIQFTSHVQTLQIVTERTDEIPLYVRLWVLISLKGKVFLRFPKRNKTFMLWIPCKRVHRTLWMVSPQWQSVHSQIALRWKILTSLLNYIQSFNILFRIQFYSLFLIHNSVLTVIFAQMSFVSLLSKKLPVINGLDEFFFSQFLFVKF